MKIGKKKEFQIFILCLYGSLITSPTFYFSIVAKISASLSAALGCRVQ